MMKSLSEYIKEGLDVDNIYYKMNIFFGSDEIQRQLFNGYYVDGDLEKLTRDGFLLKEFVDFVYDDVYADPDKDYVYQIGKIRNLLQSKNYNPL